MSANIITITREFGSGGRTIGKELAACLGYDFYDWEIVTKLEEESGFSKDYIENNSEDAGRFAWLFHQSQYGMDLQDQLFAAQAKVIRQIADKGHCVIVGRCADYLLEERDDVFSAFIFGQEQARKDRVLNVYGERSENIDKRLRDKDRRRKSHYQYYTGRKWGKAFYYDICLDSSVLGIDLCVKILEECARSFKGNTEFE